MKKSFIVPFISITSFFVFSSFAIAADSVTGVSQGIGTISGLIQSFTQNIVKALGGLAMAAAMVVFFFGIVQYIWGLRQGDAGKTKTGNEFIKWGLVALFVMFSVYGIINFTQSSICPTCNWTTITIPDINFKAGGGSPSPSQTGSGQSGQTVYLCPDGVTPYYNQSDAKFCPKGSSSNTGNSQKEGLCPDGLTRYYNNDANTVCPTQ